VNILSYIDTRIQYTERKIKDCFVYILSKKEIHKITVKEICDMAKINRSTFYLHYKNCYDLFDNIKESMFHELTGLISGLSNKNLELNDIFSKIMMNIKENKLYYITVSQADITFTNRIVNFCFEKFSDTADGSKWRERFFF